MKIIKRLIILIFMFIFKPLLLMIHFILRPFIVIKIGLLRHSRIGHLIVNTETMLRSKSLQKINHRELNLFICGSPVANRQVLKMIKRRLLVMESGKLHSIFHRCFANSNILIDLSNAGSNSNLWDMWNKAVPQLSFSEEEKLQGSQFLNSIGLGKTPFVCFFSRDNLYLNTTLEKRNWSYHNYRNSDINNYILAAEFLVSQGIPSLRMGAKVDKQLKSTHNLIIDYATNFRSDFADVYLLAHCKFFFGDTAGMSSIGTAFNVPCALVNSIPLTPMPRGIRDLCIPKKYWHIKSKHFLTFSEIFKIGGDHWRHEEKYLRAGIEIVENTPNEIFALVKEMNHRLDGTWKPQEEDEELQECFRKLLPLGHRKTGFPSRLGAEFLRQNRELLD